MSGRRRVACTVAALGVALLAGCRTDTNDFRRSAEEFLQAALDGARAGTTFTDAVCVEPASTAVATTFTCTATAADGTRWTFAVRIVQGEQFEITGRPEP